MPLNLYDMPVEKITEVNVSALPAVDVSKGPKVIASVIGLMGLVFLAETAFKLYGLIVANKASPLSELIVLPIFGTGMLILGLYLLVYSKITTIDTDRVSVRKRSLFGMKEWSEPLSAYEGVLAREDRTQQQPVGNSNARPYTLFVVELYHKDPKKTVTLYESKAYYSKRDSDFSAKRKYYCDSLNLPAIETDGTTLIKMGKGDTKKSLKELAAERKVNAKVDLTGPLPGGISVRDHGDICEISLKQDTSALSVFGEIVMLIVLPGIFFGLLLSMYFSSRWADTPCWGKAAVVIFLGGIGTFALKGVLKEIYRRHFVTEQIRISKTEIQRCELWPWRPGKTKSIKLENVKRVIIDKDRLSKREVVVIKTQASAQREQNELPPEIVAAKTLEIGKGLSRKSLEWIETRIMSQISA